jgi:hypothetical protein
MKIYGIDFSSTPKRSKPITCLECMLDGNRLEAGELIEWRDFDAFEDALRRPGSWIAGIDFPFGQSKKFIGNIGWPDTWQGYVGHVGSLDRKSFRSVLDGYRANRPAGDKEHRRETDVKAGSISPQKLYGTPVGLMFFEGAPRLLEAGVTIPGYSRVIRSELSLRAIRVSWPVHSSDDAVTSRIRSQNRLRINTKHEKSCLRRSRVAVFS